MIGMFSCTFPVDTCSLHCLGRRTDFLAYTSCKELHIQFIHSVFFFFSKYNELGKFHFVSRCKLLAKTALHWCSLMYDSFVIFYSFNFIDFGVKSMSTGGPGSGDTCHLTDFSETWPD